MSFEPSAKNAAEELVERAAIPPAVHVGFAEAERAEAQEASVEIFVVHSQVPRTSAANPHIRKGQDLLRHIFWICAEHNNLADVPSPLR